MPNDEKQTSEKAATAASKVMTDGRTADESKTAAASALSQAGAQGRDKETGADAASAASDVLQSDDTSKKSNTAAGSSLSQSSGDRK